MDKVLNTPELSIVVPAYNENINIEVLYYRLIKVLEKIEYSYEIIFINDGSKDDTLMHLIELNKKNPNIKIIDFSRNFGKEIALTAGLDFSSGEAVIVIDADLQDPPELIPKFISKWKEGYDVVYATRTKRQGETIMKKLTAHIFYRTIKKLTTIDIPEDTGDFRLMTRQVVNSIRELREQHRFMKGIFSWVGFRQISVPYERDPRHTGNSKFNYRKLLNLAVEGITSFSFIPLQIATYLGFTASIIAILYAVYLIILTLCIGNDVPGYPSLMVAILFLGGVQLMTLGLIGEYIGRIYHQSKHRPLYVIKQTIGFNKNKEQRREKKEKMINNFLQK